MDPPPPPASSLRKIEFHLARKTVSLTPHINPNFKLETLNPSTPTIPKPPSHPSSSSSSTIKIESFDFADDHFLAFRMPFRRIGAGLHNLGNTCFLNSVLQCLTYTEPLVAYLQSGRHQATCRVAGFCALCAIQRHVGRALEATGRIVSPKDLVSNLRCISRNFRNARQEDAHEYMINLLESMHKCCLPSGVPAESPGAYEKSLVHKIFGGRLRSQVKCLQCSHCSNTFDPFLDLSLEIVKADSLYKALRNFTAPEQLDGGERHYRCERCKQKVRALKQLTVFKAPYVLTIHLKRFRTHFSGQKIDKKVQFGSTLDLKPFVTGDYQGDMTYTLYGVLVHAGWSTHSGHYYCYVRTSSGLWYSLDDNRVLQVSERVVMEQKAYMLFYVRDRKNSTPKKSISVVQTENLITTPRNASSSCSVPVGNGFQNGVADKKSREAITPGLFMKPVESSKGTEVVALPNLPKNALSNDTSVKQDLNPKLNGVISSKPSVLKKENTLLQKTDLDGVVNSTPKGRVDSPTRDSAKTMALDTNCHGNQHLASSQSDVLVSGDKPAILNCPSSIDTVVCSIPSDMKSTVEGTKSQDSLSIGEMDIKPETIVLSHSTVQQNTDSGICKEGALEPVMDTPPILIKVSNEHPRMNGSVPAKSRQCPLRRKSMKILKPRALGGMHLSTKMLYGASLVLKKRRKSKMTKQRKQLEENLRTQDLVPADMGPSTSDRVSFSGGSSFESHKTLNNSCSGEGGKDTAKKFAINSDCKLPIVNLNNELQSGVKPCQAVPLSAKVRQETTSMSGEASGNTIADSYLKKQVSQSQNGVTSSVAGVPEESIVSCWEGIVSPPANMEVDDQEIVRIGHVGDDWDEEYDRGKRKMVRGLKDTYDGPNLFQVAATKNTKLKRKKTGQHFSVNEPFRI